MLKAIGLSTKRKALRVMQDPIQHGSGENRVTHHLCPLRDLLVGGEDDGCGLVGVADEGEEAVRLGS